MINLDHIQTEHASQIDALAREVAKVYSTLVLPHWGTELHGFPLTLYGYMMMVYARIDLLSAFWKGDTSTRGQTRRMIDFADKFISPNHEANSVAVQMWRHKLMHTSEPRQLLDPRSGKTYRWLLHWGDHLPLDQHYTFAETSDSKILNLGLAYLIEDLRKAVEKYLSDLHSSQELKTNYKRVKEELSSYQFKEYS